MTAVTWEQIPNLVKTIGLVVGITASGVMGWMAAMSSVAEKADRSEVQQLRLELQSMARDVRTIRLMLCDGQPSDSYCRVP